LLIQSVETAPAKVNLTLRVLGRRPDGYHDIESLVAFAGCGDRLAFTPGETLSLTTAGLRAAQAGDDADNLVVKAANALAARIPGIRLGAFHLDKDLPVAAGLGGGSADAAAALRLLAQANGLSADDPRLQAAACATGADVPVCLDPRPRLMRGIGDTLSAPVALPPLHAVLVNPGAALATKRVFDAWVPSAAGATLDSAAIAQARTHDGFLRLLESQPNDLESAATGLAPVIADVIRALRAAAGCGLARMSGSGATCFGLFDSAAAAQSAAGILRNSYPKWWVSETELG
jgi:4-diphosphocytidyl-2-C-methyl-D-erythritol kinase